jgi:hypothetical protein
LLYSRFHTFFPLSFTTPNSLMTATASHTANNDKTLCSVSYKTSHPQVNTCACVYSFVYCSKLLGAFFYARGCLTSDPSVLYRHFGDTAKENLRLLIPALWSAEDWHHDAIIRVCSLAKTIVSVGRQRGSTRTKFAVYRRHCCSSCIWVLWFRTAGLPISHSNPERRGSDRVVSY